MIEPEAATTERSPYKKVIIIGDNAGKEVNLIQRCLINCLEGIFLVLY
jgi:hypothetical protein